MATLARARARSLLSSGAGAAAAVHLSLAGHARETSSSLNLLSSLVPSVNGDTTTDRHCDRSSSSSTLTRSQTVSSSAAGGGHTSAHSTPTAGAASLRARTYSLSQARTASSHAHSHSAGGSQPSEQAEGPQGAEDPAKAVLAASLPFVLESGWTEASMLEGARAAGLSPAMLSLFPRREAHLVEYFMDECRRGLERECGERSQELQGMADLGPRLELVVRLRLEQQALYTSTWAQALSIQALPTNLQRTAQQRMQLVASLWGAAGERTRSDMEARGLCTMLSAVYTASELFMLTDFSPGYEDTWQFVHRRTSEGLQAFDGLATAQEQLQAAATSFLRSMGLTGTSAKGAPPGPHSHHRREDSNTTSTGSTGSVGGASTSAGGQEHKA